jgi:hypothetical protein
MQLFSVAISCIDDRYNLAYTYVLTKVLRIHILRKEIETFSLWVYNNFFLHMMAQVG